MRNRVQARPRYHPPLSARPSSAVRPPLAGVSTLHLARFCAALSFRESAFLKNSPPSPTSFPSRKRRLSFGLPLITSPAFFSPSYFFLLRARNGASTCATAGAAGWKCSPERTNEGTNEGADGVLLIFLLARTVLSFVMKLRPRGGARRAGGGGGGGGEGAQGREMIFSPQLNYGRAMECACYSFAAPR